MKKLVPVLALFFALGACNPLEVPRSIFDGGSGVTSIFVQTQNPVGNQQLAELELTYQVLGRAYVACRDVRCTTRANLRKYQALDQKAHAALVSARKFVRENPTISAASALAAARAAVANYQTELKKQVRT